MKTINSIQALRGIAAILVMLFHIRLLLNFTFYPFGDALFLSGEGGVTLFFVLSGFVMAYTQKESGAAAACVFIIKRFSRIFPLYFIATCVFGILGNGGVSNFIQMATSGDVFRKSIAFYPIDVSQSPQMGYAQLFVGWTLNYEMFFYAMFGASLIFRKYRYVFLSVAFSILLILIPTWTREISFEPSVRYLFSTEYLNLATNPIIWNFLIGTVAGCLVGKGKGILTKGIHLWLLCATTFFVVWQYFAQFYPWHGVFRLGVGLAIFIWLLADFEVRYGLNAPRWLTYLGKISFSIYLLHPIAQLGIGMLLKSQGFESLTKGPSFVLLTSGVTILTAHWTQIIIEQWLSNKFRDCLLFLTRPFVARGPSKASPSTY